MEGLLRSRLLRSATHRCNEAYARGFGEGAASLWDNLKQLFSGWQTSSPTAEQLLHYLSQTSSSKQLLTAEHRGHCQGFAGLER